MIKSKKHQMSLRHQNNKMNIRLFISVGIDKKERILDAFSMVPWSYVEG